MTEVRAGTLLLARPVLLDPNFVDTVVMLLDIAESGIVGVVLNRPTTMPVAEVLHPWRDVVSEPGVVFQGGPVGPDGAIAVGRLSDPDDVPVGFDPIGVGRLGLLDLDTPVELVAGSLDALRVFVGYSGWGLAQLQREIEEGSWYVVDGDEADPFRVEAHRLWGDVLRRQPGDLAWHSTRPADPELN